MISKTLEETMEPMLVPSPPHRDKSSRQHLSSANKKIPIRQSNNVT
jgi:hypothetical protein